MKHEAFLYLLCFVLAWPTTIDMFKLAYKFHGFTRGLCLGCGVSGLALAGIAAFLAVQSLMT